MPSRSMEQNSKVKGLLMGTALIKFIGSIAFLLILAAAISGTEHEGWLTAWFLLFIFAALPVFILSWIDFGKTLRSIHAPSSGIKLIGLIFGMPQALLGALSIALGISIIAWVLYNSLIEAQSQYSGGFLTFGVGPALVVFGVYWIRAAFKRDLYEQEIGNHKINN